MSRFTQQLKLMPLQELEPNGKEHAWILINDDLAYEVGNIGSNELIEIPKGFVTDLASVPKPLWWFIAPFGSHAKSALLHDWLYRSTPGRTFYTRKQADYIFREAMVVDKVPKTRASIMFLAVRLFGGRTYKNHNRAKVLKLKMDELKLERVQHKPGAS